MNSPQITVFMAAYNTEAYIAAAISSILSQTFEDFELLVVNDGSTDGTVDMVQSFKDPRIRLLHNLENSGLDLTRNRALEEARGDYIAVLDSDDVAVPERLQWQYEFMKQQPEVALCGGHTALIDGKGQLTGQRFIVPTGNSINAHLLFGNPFINSSAMFKTTVFKELQGYRNYSLGEDFDFFLRISEKYPVANIDRILVKYRVHGNNVSAIKPVEKRNREMGILKDMYKRWDFPVDDHFVHLHYCLYSRNYASITLPNILLVLHTLKQINRGSGRFPEKSFEALLFEKWYESITLKKAGREAFPLLFKKELFDFSYLTFKQFKRVFKQSVKGFFITK